MVQPSSPLPRRYGRYGVASCVLFALTLLIFILSSTLFDASLGALSLATQRWIGALTLALPPATGAVLALIGLRRDAGKTPAVVGLILNALAALFFALVLSFAG